MGKKVLCISFLDETIQCLEAERQHAGYFPRSTSVVSTNEALLASCKKADEIYINGSFPTATFERQNFPRLKKRLLQNLVSRSAQEKAGSTNPLEVRFRVVGSVEEGGATKSQISYVAVEKRDIASLQAKLQSQFKKVRNISPLPVSLAAVVREQDKPEKDFIVVWVGEESSIISFNSPGGEVKLARNVPVGLPHKEDVSKPTGPVKAAPPPDPVLLIDDEEPITSDETVASTGPGLSMESAAEEVPAEEAPVELPEPVREEATYHGMAYTYAEFSNEIDRELSMTTTFFKQKFREAPPKIIYFFGSSRLREIIGKYPLSFIEELDVRYELSRPLAQGMAAEQLNKNIHLLSSLYIPRDFSFVPTEELFGRTADLAANIAVAAMVVVLVLGGFWSFGKNRERAEAQAAYNNSFQERQALEQKINDLQTAINKLQPIKARKSLYETTVLNQPSWKNVLSELAYIVPPQVVISQFNVSPAGKIWGGTLGGEIRAENWQEGLTVLREFGKNLHAAANFDVTKVDYTLGKMEGTTKNYTFSLAINIFPESK